MFIQTVIQATLKRLNKALPLPPAPDDPARPRDRTGLIFVLFMVAVAVAFAITAALS